MFSRLPLLATYIAPIGVIKQQKSEVTAEKIFV